LDGIFLIHPNTFHIEYVNNAFCYMVGYLPDELTNMQLFPLHISATVIAGINFFSMTGAAVLMPVMGRVIEAYTKAKNGMDPAQAYHLAFLICCLGMSAGVIFHAFSKEKK